MSLKNESQRKHPKVSEAKYDEAEAEPFITSNLKCHNKINFVGKLLFQRTGHQKKGYLIANTKTSSRLSEKKLRLASQSISEKGAGHVLAKRCRIPCMENKCVLP